MEIICSGCGRNFFARSSRAPWPVVLLQAGVPGEEESPVAEAQGGFRCPLPPQPEDEPGRTGEEEPRGLEERPERTEEA